MVKCTALSRPLIDGITWRFIYASASLPNLTVRILSLEISFSAIIVDSVFTITSSSFHTV